MKLERETISILFLDIVGYSKLNEPQLRDYFERVLPQLASIINKEPDKHLELNTWGDGVFIVSKDPYWLAQTALHLRDHFKTTNWLDYHLPTEFACRISLNTGVAFIGHDPLRNRGGVVGSQINLGARIEPVTPTGEVFVTDQFARMIDTNVHKTLNSSPGRRQ